MVRRAAHWAIRTYQLTLSGLIGRQCRHWPSCSEYTWMGFSRICRCGPFGTHGIDLVPDRLPAGAAWYRPWAYARWRGVEAPPSPFLCESVRAEGAPAERRPVGGSAG
jgi:putative component of membrane protein insertase Oxa1/YidC/SpoIIIJ protein YidD